MVMYTRHLPIAIIAIITNPSRPPIEKGGFDGSAFVITAATLGAIQSDVVFVSSLSKGRVKQGFRVACHSPAERCSDAAEHAACKAGGIFGGEKFAPAPMRNQPKSPSILAGRVARCIGQPSRRRAACRSQPLLNPLFQRGKQDRCKPHHIESHPLVRVRFTRGGFIGIFVNAAGRVIACYRDRGILKPRQAGKHRHTREATSWVMLRSRSMTIQRLAHD